VEILLWLVPPVVVTAVAMLWVSWLGREGRGEVDRDVAVRRLAAALGKDAPAGARQGRPVRERERSTGIAVRPSRTTNKGPGSGPGSGSTPGDTRRSA
jgi:hypothetical protein